MKTRSQVLFVAPVALVLGYAVGAGRLASPTAVAGPPESAGTSSVTTHLTSDPGGTTLVVWTLRNGEVVSARSTMMLDDRTFDAKGAHIANPRLTASTYTLPAAEASKPSDGPK